MSKATILSLSDELSIIDQYQNDKHLFEIRNEFRTSVRKIKNILNKHNIKLKPAQFVQLSYTNYLKILDKSFVESLYKETKTLIRFGERIGCSIDMARSILKMHDIHIMDVNEHRQLQLNSTRTVEFTDQTVIAMYLVNVSINNIIKHFNISRVTVNKILNKHKIESREYGMVFHSSPNKYKLFDEKLLTDVRKEYDSIIDASKHCGCSVSFMRKQLNKFNIQPYTLSETRTIKVINKMTAELPDYKVVSRNNKIFTVMHDKCGNTFDLHQSSLMHYRNDVEKISFLCPHCNIRISTSSAEKFIKEYIESLGLTVLVNNRSILGNRELDIVIPERNIAIEYCGLYWHSDVYKDSSYHKDKYDRCKEKGIRLITIFEDEWIHKKKIVLSKIRHILGYNKEKIYARKCNVKIIDSKTRNTFLNKYHIQGGDKASYSFGLFYDNDLVAVISFSKMNIAKGGKHQENVYELSRFATSKSVVGGFSKLLKHFETVVNPTKLITYADCRWSMGDVYEKNGFIYDKCTVPNYWYISPRFIHRIHRYNFRKQLLKSKFPDFYDDSLSEMKIMSLAGYQKIWDCGHLKYIKNYNNKII